MFGHDMSWASFHVLEVMSSAKYLQKRVGYLSAVQSFRPDTEVLMLATNLLKKVCRCLRGVKCRQDADGGLGFNVNVRHHHVPPNNDPSTYHHKLPGSLCPHRLIATFDALESSSPKEVHCNFVQISPCLPGDLEACLAEDKGAANG